MIITMIYSSVLTSTDGVLEFFSMKLQLLVCSIITTNRTVYILIISILLKHILNKKFVITMCLIFNLFFKGGSPYVGKDEQWLMDMLKDNYRMPRPTHVSEDL